MTIAEPAEAIYKERSSKFLTYAYPVESEEEIKELLDALRKEYYDATHHCYAYRLGPHGEHLLSADLTNCLVVVVRYFGGTKLGVSGLIQAYKESTAEVIAVSKIIEKTVDRVVDISFDYTSMNGVMRVIKEMNPRIDEQVFDNICSMRLRIRESEADQLKAKLLKVDYVTIEE